jgi:hypothetical protein
LRKAAVSVPRLEIDDVRLWLESASDEAFAAIAARAALRLIPALSFGFERLRKKRRARDAASAVIVRRNAFPTAALPV